MISAHATHPGLIRKNNEDCVRTDDTLGLYLLADGIGGHNGGEIASALAVNTVHSIIRSNMAHTESDGYLELMLYAMQTAHWEIQARAQSDPALTKMGTTLVIVLVDGAKAYVVNAGDSRCYFYRNDTGSHLDASGTGGKRLSQLTHDHTLGDQLLESGVAMSEIPKRQFHALVRSLGCASMPYPDFCIAEMNPGDLLLICSDGLTDMLSDDEIQAVLANGGDSLGAVAQNLIDAANAHGGRDNVSVVLVTPL